MGGREKLNVATPAGRRVLVADGTDFDWGETRISRFTPIAVMNAHSFASMQAPPNPVSDHLCHRFGDDLASGGIEATTRSGRAKQPVLDGF